MKIKYIEIHDFFFFFNVNIKKIRHEEEQNGLLTLLQDNNSMRIKIII